MDNLLWISLGVLMGALGTWGLLMALALRSEGREEKAALEAGRNNKWLA